MIRVQTLSSRARRTGEGAYLVSEAVAVEMDRVQVYLVAHAHQVPVDFIALVHGEALQVPKHSSIDSWGKHEVSVLPFRVFYLKQLFFLC